MKNWSNILGGPDEEAYIYVVETGCIVSLLPAIDSAINVTFVKLTFSCEY